MVGFTGDNLYIPGIKALGVTVQLEFFYPFAGDDALFGAVVGVLVQHLTGAQFHVAVRCDACRGVLKQIGGDDVTVGITA